jgi:hypothetical protein
MNPEEFNELEARENRRFWIWATPIIISATGFVVWVVWNAVTLLMKH